ncbi:hypothetical protein BN1058_01704 [Paraliobacillus sp. PM-2]|uniref:DUF58 domain-containing protein n=1 Tax=Paraliobacillus sp. PM-2 TaxID=1462524 RepID=UPI00061BE7C0|nr:DUF58 domain-containing protein [Paraliobacillus sp. PM-2]CQR47392.1 hypothetical protein BN1058_01704 [Paraliobacillus sp. PM-2]
MNQFHLISRILQLIVLFGVLFSYAMFQGGFVSWFLFYAFVPLFLYFILFLLYPISRWKINRTLSHATRYAGGKVEVTVEITRKVGVPLPFIIIEDCFGPSLKNAYYSREIYQFLNQPNVTRKNRVKKKIHFPLFKRIITYRYVLDALPRGLHQLQATRVKTSDFFGIIQKQYSFPLENTLIVYPQTRRLAMRQSRNNIDEGASPRYATHSSHTHVVNGIREYMPGDRFSWIDWKATARKQEMITKEFEQEKHTDQLLILDASYYQGTNTVAFEANVELVHSFLNGYDGKNTNLSLLSIGEQTKYFSSIQIGGKHAILQHLAMVQPEGEGSFSEQLRKNVNVLSPNLIVHVFVSNLTQERMQVLGQLCKKMNRVVVYMTKASEEWTDEDNWYLEQCRYMDITLNRITEDKLKQAVIEVSV